MKPISYPLRRAIRIALVQGDTSQVAIAKRFGVSQPTVSKIAATLPRAAPIKRGRGRPRLTTWGPTDERVGFALSAELHEQLKAVAGWRGVSAFVREAVIAKLGER